MPIRSVRNQPVRNERAVETDAIERLRSEGAAEESGIDDSMLDDLLADLSSSRTPAHDDADAAKGASLSKANDGIDDLLAQMDAAADSKSDSKAESSLPISPASETLTKEVLEELVEKHTGETTSRCRGLHRPDRHRRTRSPDVASHGAPDERVVTEILAKKESDIDALLNDVDQDIQMMDAVSDSVLGGQTTHAGPMMPVAIDPGAIGGEELRGTRYLLVTSVCLLAMCAVTLGFVVSAINTLSQELRDRNKEEETVTDQYQQDMDTPTNLLAKEDETSQLRGVQFLENIKNDPRHSEHIERTTLRLARYYAMNRQHAQAVEEFDEVFQASRGLLDDPSVYLDYAKSLRAVEDLPAAREVVIALLANEDYYTDPEIYVGDLGEDPGEAPTNRSSAVDICSWVISISRRSPKKSGHRLMRWLPPLFAGLFACGFITGLDGRRTDRRTTAAPRSRVEVACSWRPVKPRPRSNARSTAPVWSPTSMPCARTSPSSVAPSRRRSKPRPSPASKPIGRVSSSIVSPTDTVGE